jgi:hypothetical protein
MNAAARIRIKTEDLLRAPEMLSEAKTLCDRVCLERDLVVLEPKPDHLVSLVVMLSNRSLSYSLEFGAKDLVRPVQVVHEIQIQ